MEKALSAIVHQASWYAIMTCFCAQVRQEMQSAQHTAVFYFCVATFYVSVAASCSEKGVLYLRKYRGLLQ